MDIMPFLATLIYRLILGGISLAFAYFGYKLFRLSRQPIAAEAFDILVGKIQVKLSKAVPGSILAAGGVVGLMLITSRGITYQPGGDFRAQIQPADSVSPNFSPSQAMASAQVSLNVRNDTANLVFWTIVRDTGRYCGTVATVVGPDSAKVARECLQTLRTEEEQAWVGTDRWVGTDTRVLVKPIIPR